MTLFPKNSEFVTRVLPEPAYRQLRQSLWQLADASQGLRLSDTDRVFPTQVHDHQSGTSPWQGWLLVVTPTTQALLVHQSEVAASSVSATRATYTVGLMTDPKQIGAVIAHWEYSVWAQPIAQSLVVAEHRIRDRSGASGTELLMTLLPILATLPIEQATDPDFEAAMVLSGKVQTRLD